MTSYHLASAARSPWGSPQDTVTTAMQVLPHSRFLYPGGFLWHHRSGVGVAGREEKGGWEKEQRNP